MKKLLSAHYIILAAILFLIFILRFPSLFEPYWYGDEGIFAAVARNLNHGGVLYATAWDNKPPMIYLTYAAIFKIFGVSMFWLRLATIIVVLSTSALIYEIAKNVLSGKQALAATFIFGFLTSLRLVEGNLSLTEIFMILPITLAMFVVILRKFDYISLFFAGILFACASLYKQVGALEAGSLGIFLYFYSDSFFKFVKKGIVLTLGFAVPFVITILYFAPKGLLGDFLFAAYTYYRIYLGESPQRAIVINFLKFAPVFAAILYGLFKKFHKIYSSSESEGRVEKSQENSSRPFDTFDKLSASKLRARTIRNMDTFHLILLWTAFSFLGSFFSGRTYGHYLVQAVPAISLLLASFDLRPKLRSVQIAFCLFFFIPIIILTKILFFDFLSAGPINQISYWQNFMAFLSGKKSLNSYNDYFDRNVNSIMALSDFLKINKAAGQYVYIWGDYPWLYAIADVKNPTRYVTSFHVFGVPTGKEEVMANLSKSVPTYIIKPPNSIGYFETLERLINREYTYLVQVENSKIWARSR